MKVKLIKEAYYDINEKKASNLPFMTFMKFMKMFMRHVQILLIILMKNFGIAIILHIHQI